MFTLPFCPIDFSDSQLGGGERSKTRARSEGVRDVGGKGRNEGGNQNQKSQSDSEGLFTLH